MPDTTYQPAVYLKQGGSEQVIASGGKITVESGGSVNMAVAAVTAVGSVQSLATNSLIAGLNVIAGGGTNLGVKLPTPVAGMQVIVKNSSASTAIIYGDVTATYVNATSSFSLADTKTTRLICQNSTQWWTDPVAVA